MDSQIPDVMALSNVEKQKISWYFQIEIPMYMIVKRALRYSNGSDINEYSPRSVPIRIGFCSGVVEFKVDIRFQKWTSGDEQ